MANIPPELPSDLLELIVDALTRRFLREYQATRPAPTADLAPRDSETAIPAPPTWLTVKEAAGRARCGPKLIYREVAAERLRAVRVGGGRSLRFKAEWIDAWLEGNTSETGAGSRMQNLARRQHHRSK